MPDRDGMAVMDAMRRDGPAIPVIVQTAQSSLDAIVSAMRNGAFDFFVKPVDSRFHMKPESEGTALDAAGRAAAAKA